MTPLHSPDVSPYSLLCTIIHGQIRNAVRSGFFPDLTVHPPFPPDPSPVPSSSSTYHAIIGGIVAFIVFLLLILLIFLGHYLIRHKGQRREGSDRRTWEPVGRSVRAGRKKSAAGRAFGDLIGPLVCLRKKKCSQPCDN